MKYTQLNISGLIMTRAEKAHSGEGEGFSQQKPDETGLLTHLFLYMDVCFVGGRQADRKEEGERGEKNCASDLMNKIVLKFVHLQDALL